MYLGLKLYYFVHLILTNILETYRMVLHNLDYLVLRYYMNINMELMYNLHKTLDITNIGTFLANHISINLR